MSLFDRLLRRTRGAVPAVGAEASPDRNPHVAQIERARELARAGDLHEAARAYSKLPRKETAPEILLEHAEVLLAMGDYFRAASTTNRVLEVDPKNARALAIRKAVSEQEL